MSATGERKCCDTFSRAQEPLSVSGGEDNLRDVLGAECVVANWLQKPLKEKNFPFNKLNDAFKSTK